jgi:hypothetical protein
MNRDTLLALQNEFSKPTHQQPKAIKLMKDKKSDHYAVTIQHPDGRRENKWVRELRRSKSSNRQYVVGVDNTVYQVDPSAEQTGTLGETNVAPEEAADRNISRASESMINRLQQRGFGPGSYQAPSQEAQARAADIGLGTLNSLYAGYWGFFDKYVQEPNMLKKIPSGLIGAMESAWRSISHGGDWGTTFDDYVKRSTGRSWQENMDITIRAITDTGEKEELRRGAEIAKKISGGALKFLAEVGPDVAVGGGSARALHGIVKHFKSAYGADNIAKWAKQGNKEAKMIDDLIWLTDDTNRLEKAKKVVDKTKGIKDSAKQMNRHVAREAKESVEETARLQARQSKYGPIGPIKKRIEQGAPGFQRYSRGRARKALDKTEQTMESAAKHEANMIRQQHNYEPQRLLSWHKANTGSIASKNLDAEHNLKAGLEKATTPEGRRELIQKIAEGRGEGGDWATRAKIRAEKESWLELDKLADETTEAGEDAWDFISLDEAARKGYKGDFDGGITLDFLGLSTAKDMIKKAGSKLKNKLSDDEVERQIDDVYSEVVAYFKKSMDDRGVFNFPDKFTGMKEIARNHNFRITRYGKKFKIKNMADKNSPAKIVKSLDDAARELGYTEGVEKAVRDLSDLNRGVQAEKELDLFKDWAFPSGMENVTVRQADKAAKRLKKLMDNRRSPRFTFLDREGKSMRTVLGRTPSGKRLYDILRNTKDDMERFTSKDFAEIHDTVKPYGFKDGDLEQLRFALEGMDEKVVNPDVWKAVPKVRKKLDEIYKRYQDAGLKPAPYRKNYFPHRIHNMDELETHAVKQANLDAIEKEGLEKWGFSSKQHAEDVYDEFVKSLKAGQPTPYFENWGRTFHGPENWAKMWKKIRGKYGKKGSKMMTRARGEKNPVPFYERNFYKSMLRYTQEANHDIAVRKHLGKMAKNEEWPSDVAELVKRIDVEGGNMEVIGEFLNAIVNPHTIKRPGKYGRAALQFQTVTKLSPETSLLNLSQYLATTLRTGLKPAIRGIADYNRKYGEETGAIFPQAMGDITALEGGKHGLASGYLRAIGFKKAERTLRAASAAAGKDYAQQLTKKLMYGRGRSYQYARRQLRNLSIDADAVQKRGYITDDEIQLISKRISDETQYRGNEMDIPIGWTGPGGRIMTQFKTFAYNQAMLMKRMVMDEAKRGNFRPLLFASTVYPLVGNGYHKLVDETLLGKDGAETWPGWWWQGFTSIGSLGIFESALTGMKYGAKSFYERIAGPTYSDIVDSMFFVNDVIQGKDFGETLLEGAAERLPGFQPFMRATIRAKKNQADESSGYGGYGGSGGYEGY